jgi:hypothetical protein
VTDDPPVVVEGDMTLYAVERRTEEREARGIRRYGVPQSHATAVLQHAMLRVEAAGGGHGALYATAVRDSLLQPASRVVEPRGTTSTGQAAFRTNACDVPPSTSVLIGP